MKAYHKICNQSEFWSRDFSGLAIGYMYWMVTFPALATGRLLLSSCCSPVMWFAAPMARCFPALLLVCTLEQRLAPNMYSSLTSLPVVFLKFDNLNKWKNDQSSVYVDHEYWAHLSFSQSSETRKKPGRKKWPGSHAGSRAATFFSRVTSHLVRATKRKKDHSSHARSVPFTPKFKLV